MRTVKSLLLGSAAGLIAVAGAQAADLPVKAKPVQYVKICTLYGEGWYYIPGSDTCIRLGGYIRADYGWNVTGSRTPQYSGTAGARDRTVSEFSTRHRLNITMDTRTQSQYGTLRTLTSLHVQNENQSESFNAARAFIQWAGFSFGRMQSFQDTWAISDSWHYAQQQNNSDTGANGVNSIAYTWELGNGMTLTLGADETRRKSLSNLSVASTVKVGAEPTSTFAGERFPDPYVAFKVDQAWGYWATSFVAHDVRGQYNNTGPAGCQTLTTQCGPVGDKIGWAIQTGAEFKLPMIAAGDRFGFTARYSQGAGGFGGGSNLSSADLFGSGNNAAVGFITDGIYVDQQAIQLTTVWTVGAGFEHYWTPELKTSFTGAYSKTSYNGNAKAIIAQAMCGGPTVAPPGIGAAVSPSVTIAVGGNCNPDWGFFQGGVRTQWSPIRGFFLGVDVGYTKVWTAFAGTATLATAATTVIGARPGGVYSLANEDSVYGIFRAQRVFNAGD